MKILGCFIILILVEELCNYIFKGTKLYKRYLKDANKFVEGVPDNIEIACVGSGPGYHGISFENSGKKGFNFCTAPQNFEYGYKILRQYKDKLKKGCIIIIIIMCPMSFGKNNSVKNKNYSDKYYYFLDKDYIENYSAIKNFWLQRPLLVILIQRIKHYVNAVKRRVIKSKSSTHSTVSGWIAQFNLQDLKNPEQAKNHGQCFADKRAVLCEEIEFLKDNGFNPLFVVPPIPEVTRKEISEEFIQAFSTNNLVQVAEEKDVPVFNYYDDERISQDMFTGDIFLNPQGRKSFSELLLKDIKELKFSE